MAKRDEEVREHSNEGKKSPEEIRAEIPDPDAIVSEKPFTSPKGTRYRIITTNETDPYDEPAKSEDGEKR